MSQEFEENDRVYSHYTGKWGMIEKVNPTEPVMHQGEPTGHTDTWYVVRWDDGTSDLMNDGGTQGWDMARIMPPSIAQRYGYGKDPKETA